jgi:hypothetical protein
LKPPPVGRLRRATKPSSLAQHHFRKLLLQTTSFHVQDTRQGETAGAPSRGQGVQARPVKGVAEGPDDAVKLVKGERRGWRGDRRKVSAGDHLGWVARAVSPRSSLRLGRPPGPPHRFVHRPSSVGATGAPDRMEPTEWMNHTPSTGCRPSGGPSRWTTPDGRRRLSIGWAPLRGAVPPDGAHPARGTERWGVGSVSGRVGNGGCVTPAAVATAACARAAPPSTATPRRLVAGPCFSLTRARVKGKSAAAKAGQGAPLRRQDHRGPSRIVELLRAAAGARCVERGAGVVGPSPPGVWRARSGGVDGSRCGPLQMPGSASDTQAGGTERRAGASAAVPPRARLGLHR